MVSTKQPNVNQQIYVSNRARDFERVVTEMIAGKRPIHRLSEIIADMVRGRSIYSPSPRTQTESSLPIPEPQSGEGQIYEQTKELMIRKPVEMVWISNPKYVEYLIPLIQSFENGIGTIATLNYDNAVELAASESGKELQTGIEKWSESGSFPATQSGIYLLKLHGSINWSRQTPNLTPERPLPHQVIRKLSADELKQSGFRPEVIFGQRNKLTAKGPFLDLLRVFKEKLDEAERLTVIGYSFRDEHVNEYIGQWFNAMTNRTIRIINGENFQSADIPFAKQILRIAGRVEDLKMDAKNGIKKYFSVSSAAA